MRDGEWVRSSRLPSLLFHANRWVPNSVSLSSASCL